MAHVVALIPDLLFGSRVQADLRAEGHTVELVGDPGAIREKLAGANVLVVDLTDESAKRVEFVESLSVNDPLEVPTLAFYSHIDADVRRRAQTADFDLIVPRSRMAREGAALVTQMVSC